MTVPVDNESDIMKNLYFRARRPCVGEAGNREDPLRARVSPVALRAAKKRKRLPPPEAGTLRSTDTRSVGAENPEKIEKTTKA